MKEPYEPQWEGTGQSQVVTEEHPRAERRWKQQGCRGSGRKPKGLDGTLSWSLLEFLVPEKIWDQNSVFLSREEQMTQGTLVETAVSDSSMPLFNGSVSLSVH